MRHVSIAISSALLLVACSDLPFASKSSIPPGSKRFEYKCPDGASFDVLMSPTGDKAKLELEGVMYELKQVRSGSGARFSDGTTTYWSKGREAIIERGGKVVHGDCKTNDL